MDVRFKINQMIIFNSSKSDPKNGATTKKDIDLTLRYNAFEFDSEFCSNITPLSSVLPDKLHLEKKMEGVVCISKNINRFDYCSEN